MVWTISQRRSNKVQAIETATSPWKAQRAMLILSAHELKNGRKADFIITPPTDLDPNIEHFNLPDWALEELRKAGV